MTKKNTLILMVITLTLGAISATVIAQSSNVMTRLAKADNTYSLTIDSSNISNFQDQDKDGIYEGTFKTASGSDITFLTNQTPYDMGDYIFYWGGSNVTLKNTTALTGIYKMEVSASVNKDQFRNDPTLRAEMRVGLDQENAFYNGDKLFSGETVTTTSIDIPPENQYGNYVNLTIISGTGQLRITSLKFYFRCSNAKSLVKVSSSDTTYGTVSIEGFDDNEVVVNSGTQVTVHAHPIIDHESEFYSSFKGWYLNGSEEAISTDLDYTFTIVPTNSYNLVARFTVAESESFNQGDSKGINRPNTCVLNKNNKYYSLQGVYETPATSHSAQTLKVNELFTEWHLNNDSFNTHLRLNTYPFGHEDFEIYDPTKIQAVIFYLDMEDDPSVSNDTRIDDLTTTNGTFTTFKGLKDSTDNKKMSKVVWTNFTSDVADVYPPLEFRDGTKQGVLWIKRMKVVYR